MGDSEGASDCPPAPPECQTLSCNCNVTSLGFVQNRDTVRDLPGNFEVVAPASAGGLVHYYRDDQALAEKKVDVRWLPATPFASGDVSAAALIQSSYGTRGKNNLEAVYVAGDKLFYVYRDDGGGYVWSEPSLIAEGVRGTPGFVQNVMGGTPGNFEVVVPAAEGLAHYSRDNLGGEKWSRSETFGNGRYDAVALIQSEFEREGEGGTLEVLARKGTRLYHFSQAQAGAWSAGQLIAEGASGSPALSQNRARNLEAITPLASGGMRHYSRDHGEDGKPWIESDPIPGMESGIVSAVSMIQSSYDGGTLEWVALRDGVLYSGSRHPQTSEWRGPYAFSAEPCCDPRVAGKWADAVPGGVVGMHAALLHSGKVLFFGFKNEDTGGASEVGVSALFDPNDNSVVNPAWSEQDSLPHPTLFSAGHSALSDGRLFVGGGDLKDQARYRIFVSNAEAAGSWGPQRLLDITASGASASSAARWYPTAVTLENGAVFMISGSKRGPVHDWGTKTEALTDVNDTWQIYSEFPIPELSAPQPVVSPFSPAHGLDLAPFVYSLPDGRVLVHSRSTTRFLEKPTDLSTARWSGTLYQTNSSVPRTYPRQGTSVLLPLLPAEDYRAGVLLIGGTSVKWPEIETAATHSVEKLDLGALPPRWNEVSPMQHGRVSADAVLLPDESILVVGGSAKGRADAGVDPVLTPELYDSRTDTWKSVCPMRVPRGSLSTALLLPDARVLVAGKDGLFQVAPYRYPELRVEIFSPPYLFSANPRPVVTGMSADSIGYGQELTVDLDPAAVPSAGVDAVALIRTGSVAHGVNTDQRFVGVTIASTPTTWQLTIVTPPNGAVAPPGYYMVFVLAKGVPSVARMLKLG